MFNFEVNYSAIIASITRILLQNVNGDPQYLMSKLHVQHAIISIVTRNLLQYINGDLQYNISKLFSPQSLAAWPAIFCNINGDPQCLISKLINPANHLA